jgi:hypothetical protein
MRRDAPGIGRASGRPLPVADRIWLPITIESGGAEARHSGIFRKVSENSGDGAGKFRLANCMHRERTGQAKNIDRDETAP